MSFRRRMVVLAAGAVAASVVLASVVVYFVTRNELRGQVDTSLREKLTPGQPEAVQIRLVNLSTAQIAKLEHEGKWPPRLPSQVGYAVSGGGLAAKVLPGGHAQAQKAGVLPGETVSIERKRCVATGKDCSSSRSVFGSSPGSKGPRMKAAGGGTGEPVAVPAGAQLVLPAKVPGGATGYVQLLTASGQLVESEHAKLRLPVTAATHAVAAGRRDAFFSDVTIAGTPERMYTARAPEGGVWQAAQPLTDVDSTLTHLKLVLAIVCLGGVALATALGLLVSRGALVPVRRLTGAAERVARTQDLGHRIPPGGQDELGRLAASFNTMLAALERSRLAQRQLVSDASHELRTPLTSVQANIDVLALDEGLAPAERARVVAAAQAQLRELTVLVGDLVDLSKTEVEEVEVEDVRLDLAVGDAVERARLHAPRARFALELEPCLVRVAPQRLDRAIANLLDNALKWDPTGEPIEVQVRAGTLAVRDHGPGIDEQDLPRIFDRFYRAASARARPGSGLGLAIVRQVAEMHGGAVQAANAPGGGARLTLELPALAMGEADLACPRALAEAAHPPPRLR